MASFPSAFSLEKCARPNILSLKPYRCARDEYPDDGTSVLLDANEHACKPELQVQLIARDEAGREHASEMPGTGNLNRYPDPHQIALKQLICNLRNAESKPSKPLDPSNLFVGNGSDEAIDNIIRCFCRPGIDKILVCTPTYGVYTVAARTNDVEIVNVDLDLDTFQLRPEAVNEALSKDPTIKLAFLCSPGNPTGELLDKNAIQQVLRHPTWNGVVLVDEAYIDFSPEGSSCAGLVNNWPNLIVLQTLSKGYALAGIRLGFAICPPQIAGLMNNMKAPYNISALTSGVAYAALTEDRTWVMSRNRDVILKQRVRMLEALSKVEGVGRIRGGRASNFILLELLDKTTQKPSNGVALKVYQELASVKSVITRYRGSDPGCEGCLRITVGTEEENSKLLAQLSASLERL